MSNSKNKKAKQPVNPQEAKSCKPGAVTQLRYANELLQERLSTASILVDYVDNQEKFLYDADFLKGCVQSVEKETGVDLSHTKVLIDKMLDEQEKSKASKKSARLYENDIYNDDYYDDDDKEDEDDEFDGNPTARLLSYMLYSSHI